MPEAGTRTDEGPLGGVRVLELAGLAPGPFAGMMLADHGASVLRIDRVQNVTDEPRAEPLDRGKRTIGLNIKSGDGVAALKTLARHADVMIEPFRPGVAERLGIGPDDLLEINPGLIYGRMTGWGQDGPLAPTAGHDIDYVAISGTLSQLGRAGEPPTPPINLLGDFAGGGLMLAFGVLLALVERGRTGRGQVVDAAMVDGAALLSNFIYNAGFQGFWGPRGTNLLDSGAPQYDTYETADGQWMALGALEPQFWAEFTERLGAAVPSVTPLADRGDRAQWPLLRDQIAKAFRTKTRDEWEKIFDGSDACVSPVLSMAEAPSHPHNAARGTFIQVGGATQPGPAPRLSGNPSPAPGPCTRLTDLSGWGIEEAEAVRLREAGVLA